MGPNTRVAPNDAGLVTLIAKRKVGPTGQSEISTYSSISFPSGSSTCTLLVKARSAS